MKSKQPNIPQPRDTPPTRKRRLQQRLNELTDSSEKELAALMNTINKVKTAFRNDRTKP